MRDDFENVEWARSIFSGRWFVIDFGPTEECVPQTIPEPQESEVETIRDIPETLRSAA